MNNTPSSQTGQSLTELVKRNEGYKAFSILKDKILEFNQGANKQQDLATAPDQLFEVWVGSFPHLGPEDLDKALRARAAGLITVYEKPTFKGFSSEFFSELMREYSIKYNKEVRPTTEEIISMPISAVCIEDLTPDELDEVSRLITVLFSWYQNAATFQIEQGQVRQSITSVRRMYPRRALKHIAEAYDVWFGGVRSVWVSSQDVPKGDALTSLATILRNYFEYNREENLKRGTVEVLQREEIKRRKDKEFVAKIETAAKGLLVRRITSPFQAADIHSTLNRIGYPIDLSKELINPDEDDERFKLGIKEGEFKTLNSWEKGVKFKAHLTTGRRKKFYTELKNFYENMPV